MEFAKPALSYNEYCAFFQPLFTTPAVRIEIVHGAFPGAGNLNMLARMSFEGAPSTATSHIVNYLLHYGNIGNVPTIDILYNHVNEKMLKPSLMHAGHVKTRLMDRLLEYVPEHLKDTLLIVTNEQVFGAMLVFSQENIFDLIQTVRLFNGEPKACMGLAYVGGTIEIHMTSNRTFLVWETFTR